MDWHRWNAELPFAVQIAGLAVLWIAGLVATGWTAARAYAYAQVGRSFADPLLIDVLMRLAIPLVLALAGCLFLRRAPPRSDLHAPQRWLYDLFFGLTWLAAILFVLYGLPVCVCPRIVIRE